MTAKQRFLTALTGGMPDRVPVAPDISNMAPCRLTGRPFWDIYLHGDPPLWKAHLDANRRFGLDAWFYRGRFDLDIESTNELTSRIIDRREDRIVQETWIRNRMGEITHAANLFEGGLEPIVDTQRERPSLLERSPCQYGLPNLKVITSKCREQGIPTLLHSCEGELVEICARETDLSCINPLEAPPTGDCILKGLKGLKEMHGRY